jgi:putative ABC transport system permease protein
MSLWRHLRHGARGLADRTAADRDTADEVEHFLSEAAAEHEAHGVSPREARRLARLQAGNPVVIREQVRSYGWENIVESFIGDLVYATRTLRRSPGFAIAAVLTLALGIGAGTAMFSAARPVLFEPLPYPDANRIVSVWDRGADGVRAEVTFGTYRELMDRNRSFDALAVMRAWQPTLTGPAEPERLDGQRVSADFFKVLGVLPSLGRAFEPADDRPNGPRVVVVSDRLWQRRFEGNAARLGRQITLDGDPYTIVGVMPPPFENVLLPTADVWRPLQYDNTLPSFESREWGHHLRMAARLRKGVAMDDARGELAAIARTPVAEFSRPPWASLGNGLLAERLQDDITRGVRPALLALLGGVVLLLAIACVNVTNLLLGRGARRRSEFAMRAALGASRARLVRQLLTESLLLALLGGALGMLIAEAGVQMLIALSPADLPRVDAIRIDRGVFAFAAAVSITVGVLVGLMPAIRAFAGDPHAGMQHGTRSTSGRHQFTRRGLVVAELALAVVLLVGAGLLFRSLQHLFGVSLGFDPSNVLTMQVQVAGRSFDDERSHRFFQDALDAVERLPGITAAAFTSQLPLSGDEDLYGVRFDSQSPGAEKEGSSALRYAVSEQYFEALRIPLHGGRLLQATDTARAPRAAVVNESFVRRRLAGQDPLGKRLYIGPVSGPSFAIVGVVGDVRQQSLAAVPMEAVYVTNEQWHSADQARWLVVRTERDALRMAAGIRAAIWSVNKDQPIVRMATMNHLVAASAAERRFALTLFEMFSAAALVLAAIGLYGVVSAIVGERTREIGIRSALGATQHSILTLVIRQGMILALFGIAIGVTAGAVAARGLTALLYSISPLDPSTYAGVILLLSSVSMLACAIPAWRAARVDPSITLKAE